MAELTAWLDDKERQLRAMESDPSMDKDRIWEQAAVLQVRLQVLQVRPKELKTGSEQDWSRVIKSDC